MSYLIIFAVLLNASVGFKLNPKFNGLKVPHSIIHIGRENKLLGSLSSTFRGLTTCTMFPDPMMVPVFQEAALINGILYGLLRMLKQTDSFYGAWYWTMDFSWI